MKNIKCVKFAELESTSSFDVFVVAAADNSCQVFDDFDLKSILETAHFTSNKFPCTNNNCLFSLEHAAIRNGRPDYHTQIRSYNFKWDYDTNSFKCLLQVMMDYIKTFVARYDGIEIFYYVKSIGSKFKTIFSALKQCNEIVKEFLSPFDMNELLSIKDSKFFVDVAWNIGPNEYFKNNKVLITFKLFYIYCFFCSWPCSGTDLHLTTLFMVHH